MSFGSLWFTYFGSHFRSLSCVQDFRSWFCLCKSYGAYNHFPLHFRLGHRKVNLKLTFTDELIEQRNISKIYHALPSKIFVSISYFSVCVIITMSSYTHVCFTNMCTRFISTAQRRESFPVTKNHVALIEVWYCNVKCKQTDKRTGGLLIPLNYTRKQTTSV